jgi:hypothetical protein
MLCTDCIGKHISLNPGGIHNMIPIEAFMMGMTPEDFVKLDEREEVKK